MNKYALGIDFGSLSARAILVRISDGCPEYEHTCAYAHGIIEGSWNNHKLDDGIYLQNPADYLNALSGCVKGVLADSGIDPIQIACVGIDGTSATIVPAAADGTALSFTPEFADDPYALALMWKSRSTQKEVEDILSAAKKHAAPFLDYVGETMPSNAGIPKLLHLLRHAPQVYHAAARFYDLCDWVVCQLTGEDVMSALSAGGKLLWTAKQGWPSEAFFAELDADMRTFARDKMPARILPSTQIAGAITETASALTGLPIGIPVATGLHDGISPLSAAGVNTPGKFMFVIGTSVSCFVLGKSFSPVRGLYGLMAGAPYPGLYTFETGLQSFGDTLSWYIEHCCPMAALLENKPNASIFDVLSDKAAELSPGESGLLAMNWWNGNRSILVDGDLSGCIFGLTLQTKPEEIYRALVEGMAFNFRMIKDEFAQNGIDIHETIAVGGIPRKNPFIMQLMADIMGCPITVPHYVQMPALGAAIFAAGAVGAAAGGYDSIEDAVAAMSVKAHDVYAPNMEIHKKYQDLYTLYLDLCATLSHSDSPVKRLRAMKNAH